MGITVTLSGEDTGCSLNNMDDIKAFMERVKGLFTKLEEAFGSVKNSKLFSDEEPRTERDLVRYALKAKAMEACAEKYTAMTDCMKQSWLGTCHRKQIEFWDCYRKETIRLRKHYDVYWDD